MVFRIQQLSDYGTANPIVARLSLQTQELLPFYNLSDKQKEEIFGLFFSSLQQKLMTCFRIMEQLTKEVRERQKRIDEVGLELQDQGRAYTLPSILDLQHRAETFLYNGKSVLRDLTDIFFILLSKDFRKEARFDKVLKWAKKEFGAEDALTKMLEEDANTWIKRIVKMRNAVEHPGGHSGTLHIENFSSIEEAGKVLVSEPLWYLNTDEKVPIVNEMNTFVTNLLTFCEETLVLCLEKFKKGLPIVIVEIPEKERDVTCPKRFKMTIDESKIKNPNKIFERR
jgi:hypothetical protein